MKRPVLSLTAEISTLTQAVAAARRLTDADHASTPTADLTELVESIGGALMLVECRLRDLGRVLRGERDPAALYAHHNGLAPDAAVSGADVVMRNWGPKRRHREAKRELLRAETNLAARQR